MARMRSVEQPCYCLLIGVDRKSAAHRWNDEVAPFWAGSDLVAAFVRFLICLASAELSGA
jgi:hypothetical protein